MDYINYVKQSPVQGLTGLYGGVQGSLMAAAAGGDPGNGSYYGQYGFVVQSEQIHYWDLQTTNNATNFGNTTTTRNDASSTAGGTTYGSASRGIVAGGDPGIAPIDFRSLASTGNCSDFGDLNTARSAPAACSNGIRGCIGGGAPQTASIEYITILTAANADNFGNLTQSRSGIDSISGGARGIWANGQAPHRTTIDYVTISSTGDATDFGETTIARTFGCGASSDPGSGQNRGVFMAGYSGVDDHVDYITCNTAGNATDWGELNSSHSYRCAGGSDGSRGFCAGGAAGGSTISYLTIDTAGSSSNAGGLGTQGGNATGFTGA